LCDGKLPQRGAGFSQTLEILADNARIDMADCGFYFAGAIISDSELIQALINLAAPEGGNVGDGGHPTYCPMNWTYFSGGSTELM
jgi:hypothetical protein